jgi:hypothetical protein
MSATITGPTFEVKVCAQEMSKGEREYQAFLRMLPDLVNAHKGRFVAIHEGQVVDTDDNDIILIQRVHSRIGYVPIYVGFVEERLPVERVPHYRRYRSIGEQS